MGRARGNETYGHAQKARTVVPEGKVLVGEGARAVDAGAAGAVAVQEVAALDHEVFDLHRVYGKLAEQFRFFCRVGRELTTRWNLLPL